MENRKKTLTVTVQSFSYRRGIPYDATGNGGGFVFDCRFIENPGLQKRYMNLTGRDREVIEFLSAEGQTAEFLDSVRKIVGMAVRRYSSIGYTHLAVSFGCTGGRHRSVYSAERLAEHLKEDYRDVEVCLKHLELDK